MGKAILISLTAGALILALVSQGQRVEPTCAEHAVMVRALGNLGQRRVWTGLDGGGNVLELFVSDASGWTLTITDDDMRACVVDAGGASMFGERAA